MEPVWTPQVVAAVAGFVGVVVGSLITWGMQARLLGRRIQADEDLAKERAKVDERIKRLEIQINARRAQIEQRTLFQAEKAANLFLSDPRWPKRRFRQIRHHIGGFPDRELRQLLVRAGAVRFGLEGGPLFGPVGQEDIDTELWGLLDRSQDNVGK